MTLLPAIAAYVTLKRALGAVFSVDARILRAFGRALGDVAVRAITPAQGHAFCWGRTPPTRFGVRKHEALRGFFRSLVGRGHLPGSPLPEPPPRVAPTFRPYIYARAELHRWLAAPATVGSARARVQPVTLRTLLVVLSGAGLRAGEALRLRCRDVDLRDRVLTIWDTKFHPIAPGAHRGGAQRGAGSLPPGAGPSSLARRRPRAVLRHPHRSGDPARSARGGVPLPAPARRRLPPGHGPLAAPAP